MLHFPNDIDGDYHALLDGRVADAPAKWVKSLNYVRRMSAFCRRHDLRMVLVAVPTQEQWSMPGSLGHYQEKLRAFAASEQIRFIDLREAMTGLDPSRLYWDWDPHFTPGGHIAVAEILYRETKQILDDFR